MPANPLFGPGDGSPRTRRVVALATMACAILLAACSDLTVHSGDTTAGVYVLRSVNGVSLPAIIDERTDYRREMLDGVISLNADGTFSDRARFRQISSGATVTTGDTIIGSWTLVNQTVTFRNVATGAQWYASLVGDRMVQISPELTLVYTR